MGNPPDALLRLVHRFDQDRKVFLSADYKEEQLRAEFLNSFFSALGWGMDKRRSRDPGRRKAVYGRQPFASLSSS